MREIGGFFELELNSNGNIYHKDALGFNSGSSALRFFLKQRKYKIVYLPYFTCEVVVKTVKELGLTYNFYKLESDLKPVLDFKIFNEEVLLLYNDYFGINSENISKVLKKTKHVLIDTAQSFYFIPQQKQFCFNSVRKFFGVPDGGFLYGLNQENILKKYEGLKQTDYLTKHLIYRLENNAESAFPHYQENEEKIYNNSIGKMSSLTKALLINVDFAEVKNKRITNYEFIHSKLKHYNQCKFVKLNDKEVPLCYPFLLHKGNDLKQHLHKNKIFIPTYWPNIKEHLTDNCGVELDLINNLVCLPIDQRYSIDDMDYMLSKIKLFFNE